MLECFHLELFLILFSDQNIIKSLNGVTFQGLFKLSSVKLISNECISEDFENPERIALLQKTVQKLCGSESNNNCDSSAATIARLEAELKASKDACTKANEETLECKSTMEELRENLKFKLEENVEMVEKLQQKEVEIIKQKEKIDELKELIEGFIKF